MHGLFRSGLVSKHLGILQRPFCYWLHIESHLVRAPTCVTWLLLKVPRLVSAQSTVHLGKPSVHVGGAELGAASEPSGPVLAALFTAAVLAGPLCPALCYCEKRIGIFYHDCRSVSAVRSGFGFMYVVALLLGASVFMIFFKDHLALFISYEISLVPGEYSLPGNILCLMLM